MKLINHLAHVLKAQVGTWDVVKRVWSCVDGEKGPPPAKGKAACITHSFEQWCRCRERERERPRERERRREWECRRERAALLS